MFTSRRLRSLGRRQLSIDLERGSAPARAGTGCLIACVLSFVTACAGGITVGAGTPLVPTASPSPQPSPTHEVPSVTPEPSSTPATQGLVAEAQVAEPFSLAWSPGGEVIAVTTARGLALLQASNLSEQRLISTDKPLEFLAFRADGDLLATTEEGTRFLLWSMPSGDLQVEQEHTITPTYGIAFDDGGDLFLSTWGGHGDLVIRIWNVGGLNAPGGADWAVEIAIAPNGRFVALNGLNGVEVWSFEAQSLMEVLRGERAAALQFSPDGSLLAAAHWDGVARLWSIDSGGVVQSFVWGEAHVSGPRTGLDFSPDGHLLAVAGQEGRILVWDLERQTLLHTYAIPLRRFNSISFSPDGKKLASIGEDGLLQIWAVGP